MSNADKPRCHECNAALPEGRAKFCSKKCGTRARVRRFRRGDISSDISKASQQQIDARIKLRQSAKDERDVLTEEHRLVIKAWRSSIRRLRQGHKRIAAQLMKELFVSDTQIMTKFGLQQTGGIVSVDANSGASMSNALAIAADDART